MEIRPHWVVTLSCLVLTYCSNTTADNALYQKGSLKFYLPAGSSALENEKCNGKLMDLVVDAKIRDMRTWKCSLFLEQSGSSFLLIENTEKPSQAWGVPSWLFKVIEIDRENNVHNIGDITARTAVIPTLTEDGDIELLGITTEGWDGRPDNPPYGQYTVNGRGSEGKLVTISTGPLVESTFDVPKVGSTDGSTNTNKGYRGERNLSDEFYSEKIAAITKYSDWKTAPFIFQEVSFVDSTFRVSYSEVPTSIQYRIKDRQAKMNKKKNYWGNFIDQSRENSISSSWNLTCLFPVSEGERLSQIPQGGSGLVQLKIVSANDDRLVFDCKF